MHLVFQSDLFQLLLRPRTPLGAAGSCQRHRQLNIASECLMRDQMIALKDESHRMIPIRVPVPALILLCRHAVNDQLPAVTVIQPSDDIQQRCLSGTARTQNRNKFFFPK